MIQRGEVYMADFVPAGPHPVIRGVPGGVESRKL